MHPPLLRHIAQQQNTTCDILHVVNIKLSALKLHQHDQRVIHYKVTICILLLISLKCIMSGLVSANIMQRDVFDSIS